MGWGNSAVLCFHPQHCWQYEPRGVVFGALLHLSQVLLCHPVSLNTHHCSTLHLSSVPRCSPPHQRTTPTTRLFLSSPTHQFSRPLTDSTTLLYTPTLFANVDVERARQPLEHRPQPNVRSDRVKSLVLAVGFTERRWRHFRSQSLTLARTWGREEEGQQWHRRRSFCSRAETVQVPLMFALFRAQRAFADAHKRGTRTETTV